MYDQRSAATHQASHSHISNTDVADLSQWIAWMLFSIVAFMAVGMKTPKEVLSTLRERAATWEQKYKQ